MQQENNKVLSYNHRYRELNNHFIDAMRQRSHDKLCEVFIQWNDIYRNAMKDGFYFWAGQAQSDFQSHVEEAVTQLAYKGDYFAQAAITEHGVITPYILSHYAQAFEKNREARETMIKNMINNGSYFIPKEYHKYIENIGRSLYTLVMHDDIDLASMLYERIVPGLTFWYEFRHIVVMTMSYADDQCDVSRFRNIIKDNLESIKEYTPRIKDLQSDDAFNTTEILFLFRSGLGEIAEHALSFANNARWISELVEIEEIRGKEFSEEHIEEFMKRSAESVLGYLFLKNDARLKTDILRKFNSIDFARALKQLTIDDMDFDHRGFKDLIERRFQNQPEFENLAEMAKKVNVEHHPVLMSSTLYKRCLLNSDLSM
jgi:hypothetical protein